MKKTQLVFGKFYCLVIFGPPNVGKGTQGPKIAAKYGLGYVSTGDIFRSDAYNGKTFLSSHLSVEDVEKLKQYLANENKIPVEEVIIEESVSFGEVIAAGVLIPDSVATPALMEEIMKHATENGIVIDGYPRTDAQANSLDEHLMSIGSKVDKVIKLDATEDELNTRRAERLTKEQRADDSVESNARRMREYFDKTIHVIPYYEKENKVVSLNGIGEIETIFASICEVIDADVVKVEETPKTLKEMVEEIVSKTKAGLEEKFEQLKVNGPEFFLVEANKTVTIEQFTTGDAQQKVSDLLIPVNTVELDGQIASKKASIVLTQQEKQQAETDWKTKFANEGAERLSGVKTEQQAAQAALDTATTLFDDEIVALGVQKYEGDVKALRPFRAKESQTSPLLEWFVILLFFALEGFICMGITYPLTRSGDDTVNLLASYALGAFVTFGSWFTIKLSHESWNEPKGRYMLVGLAIAILSLTIYRANVNVGSGTMSGSENGFAIVLNLVLFIVMTVVHFKSHAKQLNQDEYFRLIELWGDVQSKKAAFNKKDGLLNILLQQQKDHANKVAGSFDSSESNKKIQNFEREAKELLNQKGKLTTKFQSDEAITQKAVGDLQKLETDHKKLVKRLFEETEQDVRSGKKSIFGGTTIIILLLSFFGLMSCNSKHPHLDVAVAVVTDRTDSTTIQDTDINSMISLLKVDGNNRPTDEFTPRGKRLLYVTRISHAQTEEEKLTSVDLVTPGGNPDLKKEAIDKAIKNIAESVNFLNKGVKNDSSSMIFSALLRCRNAIGDTTIKNKILIIKSDGIEFQKGLSMYKPWTSDSLIRVQIEKAYGMSMPSWKGYEVVFVYPYNTAKYATQAERAANLWINWIEEKGGKARKSVPPLDLSQIINSYEFTQ